MADTRKLDVLKKNVAAKKARSSAIKANNDRFKGKYKYDNQAVDRNNKASDRALINNNYSTMNDNLLNRPDRNPDVVGRWLNV